MCTNNSGLSLPATGSPELHVHNIYKYTQLKVVVYLAKPLAPLLEVDGHLQIGNIKAFD